MGGTGSSRWDEYARRITAEECRHLSVASLVRNGLLAREGGTEGRWVWRCCAGHPPDLSVTYRFQRLGPTGGLLILSYTVQATEDPVQTRISLTATRPNFGGLRWWFLCPWCYRRCGKVYMPPKGRHFACRRCHGLTYRTCQESHRWDLIAKEYAKTLGVPVDAMIGILKKHAAQSPIMAAAIEIARPSAVKKFARLTGMPVPTILSDSMGK